MRTASHRVSEANDRPGGWLRSPLAHYVAAVLAVVAAWTLRTVLDPYLGDLQPFATFYMAVTLVAWLGGWRPALVTLFAGYVVSHWFFMPPRHALALENFADVVQHLAYFFVTGTIVLLMESLARARVRATANASLKEQSEKRFRTMAETVPDIIFTGGPDGSIDFLNRRFFEYAGGTPSATDGVELERLVHPEDLERTEAEWKESVRTSRDYQVQCRLRAADGSYRWFLRRARPVRSESGEVLKWVGCCTDVEEQKRAAEMLEERVSERTAKLQEMVEELERFSYSIAHDLRAPLRAMSSYTSLLEQELCADCLRSSNAEYLRRISEASLRMDRLIQDVLSYSGVVCQSLPLHPVDLSHLLPNLVHTYPNLVLHESEIELRSNLPTVLGNEGALSQCFGNLLDNALKFVRPGVEPRVVVRAQPLQDWVRIWVEDNGIGIPREACDRIFDLFQRAVSAEYDGTGLGLAIARKLVRRMKGEIGVDSQPGQGSRFWVELRLAVAAPLQERAA